MTNRALLPESGENMLSTAGFEFSWGATGRLTGGDVPRPIIFSIGVDFTLVGSTMSSLICSDRFWLDATLCIWEWLEIALRSVVASDLRFRVRCERSTCLNSVFSALIRVSLTLIWLEIRSRVIVLLSWSMISMQSLLSSADRFSVFPKWFSW